MPTNRDDRHEGDTPNPVHQPDGRENARDRNNPGYETTDVNVNGVIVFLSGLCLFVLVFFAFCFRQTLLRVNTGQ